MKFSFSNKSGLYGRFLKGKIDRFALVPRNEEGKIEYILGYNGKIPSESEEPGLYKDAIIRDLSSAERELNYSGIEETVVLISLEADDFFRIKFPHIVAQNEIFRIDE